MTVRCPKIRRGQAYYQSTGGLVCCHCGCSRCSPYCVIADNGVWIRSCIGNISSRRVLGKGQSEAQKLRMMRIQIDNLVINRFKYTHKMTAAWRYPSIDSMIPIGLDKAWRNLSTYSGWDENARGRCSCRRNLGEESQLYLHVFISFLNIPWLESWL